MQYENRQPKEGINQSPHNPVKTFFKLLVSTAVLVVVLILILNFSGAWLAKKIPFRFEVATMEKIDFEFGSLRTGGSTRDEKIKVYLNELAARIAVLLPNPDNVSYSVHYNTSDTFNAYATLGGNIVFFKGLLNKLPNENALAMVMAHEMAHVSHRDPVAGLGGGVASAIALSAIVGSGASNYASTLINGAGGLTAVQFTRKMESNADDAAILAVSKLYGHTNGADSLFKHIDAKRGQRKQADWLTRFTQTHPLDSDRVKKIAQTSFELGLPINGKTTPLPDFFQTVGE